jgi:hypothetical protein
MYLSSQSGLSGWGLGDTATVQAQIIASATKYGVDPNLALAVAKQESGFQQTNSSGGTLTSSAHALGVMQLIPSTAQSLGVDPNDQQQNIDGGVKYLSQLLNQFGGNVSYALAAYNAGPGAVQKYGGIPPYPQTQNYVSSILATMGISGGSSGSDSGGFSSSPDYSAPPLQSAGLFPASWESFVSSQIPGTDQTLDLGGMVLSGSDLVIVGLGIVGILVISAIL